MCTKSQYILSKTNKHEIIILQVSYLLDYSSAFKADLRKQNVQSFRVHFNCSQNINNLGEGRRREERKEKNYYTHKSLLFSKLSYYTHKSLLFSKLSYYTHKSLLFSKLSYYTHKS